MGKLRIRQEEGRQATWRRRWALVLLCVLVLISVLIGLIGAAFALGRAAAAGVGNTRGSAINVPSAGGPSVSLRLVATVTSGTALAFRPGERAVYVARQDGIIFAVRRRETLEPVLDLRSQVVSGGERGLLGLAFAPDGTHLYVDYTAADDGRTVVAEYHMGRRGPRPASARVVLTQPQPQANHNGGQLAFGPDGNLYIGLGDGGGAGDTGPGHAAEGNAQSADTWLGKILRIDPRLGPSGSYTIPAGNPYRPGQGRPEIWVSGVRNPWRFSFDSLTGDLWVGDVGQNSVEEVTRLSFRDSPGANLGWNVYEGTTRYRDGAVVGTPTPPAAMPQITMPQITKPQITMDHAEGYCSVTGGYVYRGSRIAGLAGWYLFTDYCKGTLRAARITGLGQVRLRDLGVEVPQAVSFGQDGDGELYVLSQSQGVYKIVAR